LVSPSEPHCHDGPLDLAKTEIARLTAAMIEVLSYHTQRIEKARWAISNPMPCFTRLTLSIAGSHSKSGIDLPPFCMYLLPYFYMARNSGIAL
jgi:hypothetical protein